MAEGTGELPVAKTRIEAYLKTINEKISGGTSIDKATTSKDGLMSKEDKAKLDGVEAQANKYEHPANHPASIITQDASNRFVTDVEKTAWNNKLDNNAAATTSNLGLVKKMPNVDKPAGADAGQIKTTVDALIDKLKAAGMME